MAGGNHKVTATTLTITDNVGIVGGSPLAIPTTVANGGYTNDSTLTFSGTANAGPGTGGGVNIWMSSNGGLTAVLLTATPISVGAGGGPWTFTATPPPAGDATYTYYVTDGAQIVWPATTLISSGLTLDTVTPTAPGAPSIAENSAGGINITEASNGSVVAVGLAGTGAVAGDTVHVNWGSQGVNYTLVAADITAGTANVTVGSSTIGSQGNGTFNVTASVIDRAGNAGASSSATSVTVDTIAPALTVSGAPNNDTVTLSGTVSDAHGLSTVQVFEGTTLLGTATVTAGSWTYTAASLSNGSHSFTATATDLSGNTTSGTATVTVAVSGVSATTFTVTDNVGNAPTPVADGGYTNDNLLQFSGTATFAGAAPTLKIWVDVGGAGHPTLLGTASVDAPTGHWSFTALSPAADSHYAYYVTDGSRATWDATKAVPLNGGNEPYQVELDTVAPGQPSIASADDQTLTLSGYAEPASVVQIFNGNVLLTTDALLDLTTGPIITDGATGYWQYTFPESALPGGHYQLNVKATDAAGNTSVASDSLAFDIQATVTATTFTAIDNVGNSPTQVHGGGYTNDNLLEFSGTATVLRPDSGNTPSLKIWVDIGDGNGPAVLATVAVDALTGAWSYNALSPAADNHYSYYVTDGGRSTWDPAKTVLLNDGDGSFEVQLDTVAPDKPSITSADGQTLTISGFAEPASIVEIFNGNVLLTTAELLDLTTGPIFTDGETGYWQYTFPEGVLPAGSYQFNVKATDSAGNTSPASDFQETAVCFLKGTRLQTPGGEVAVEDLQIGDLVSTRSGEAQAIKWIGRRSYVTRFVPSHDRRNVLPIRICRGALADNVPHRDLLVSPEHAMCLEGALIPARHLVNGCSIAYCESLKTIEYYHIELPRHDVLIAEGAATESWLDCGNRNFFMNVMDYAALGLPDQPATGPCLPFVNDGALLEQVRTTLLARAAAADFETTSDPDVHLIVKGQRFLRLAA